MPYSIELENVGYAAPVSEHVIQLVMIEQSTSKVCGSVVEKDITGNLVQKDDVRTWYGGETHEVIGDLKLPDDILAGTYDLFLNLADESEELFTNTDYKVSGTRNVFESSVDLLLSFDLISFDR